MFKVGDTGLTTQGWRYEVTGVDPTSVFSVQLKTWEELQDVGSMKPDDLLAITVPTYQVSATTQALIDLLIERDRSGLAKYGTTLDRTDLTRDEWLQHMAEELLDGAGYALAAKRTA